MKYDRKGKSMSLTDKKKFQISGDIWCNSTFDVYGYSHGFMNNTVILFSVSSDEFTHITNDTLPSPMVGARSLDILHHGRRSSIRFMLRAADR